MILVTGAAGLIGEKLVRRLAASGRAVVATDAIPPATPLPCRFVEADLRDPNSMFAIIRDGDVGSVIHAGAISGGMVAPNDPHRIMSVNVTGTIHLAEACRLAKVTRVLVLSSIGVYGDQENFDPVDESAPLNGADAYSASKIAVEHVLRGYAHDFGLNAKVLRISSVFGPGRRTPCFMRGLLEAHLAGRPIFVSGDTIYRRQFIYVDDAVRAVLLAFGGGEDLDFAYNVAGGTWLTESEIAEAAARAVPGFRFQVDGRKPLGLDGKKGPLSMARISRDLGFTPEISIEEGIRQYAVYLS